MTTLNINTLETWLWDGACTLRGTIDAPKYKDYILPIIFFKRLSDVFEDEMEALAKEYGSREKAEKVAKSDHKVMRFYLPQKARWSEIASLTTGIGEKLTDAVRAIAKENPKLNGVINVMDFNATAEGQRLLDDDRLKNLFGILGKYRLGLKDVEPDIIGRAYEYLLRKFAEGSGQSAGEFYTPREVGVLMAQMLDPANNAEIYDPTCGSGGLLIKSYLRAKEKKRDLASLKFYGQESIHTTVAMAKMNVFIHDMEAQIAYGDTMNAPKFLTGDGALQRFDIITANPMWNQKDFSESTYENDSYSRFGFGFPPKATADWGWIQHMYASLKDKGRMAVVLDTGAVSRGSGNQGANKERDVRKAFVDADAIEAVVLLPENLFYNTTAPGIVLVINKAKKHKGEILLINASKLFEKGRPKNYMPDEMVKQAADIYRGWKEEEGISKVVTKDEVVKNDYNLSPSRYVAQNGGEEVLPLEDAVVLLKEAEEERTEADAKLKDILGKMGFVV